MRNILQNMLLRIIRLKDGLIEKDENVEKRYIPKVKASVSHNKYY